MLPVVRFLSAPLWRVSLAVALLGACTSSGSSSPDGGAEPADADLEPADAGAPDALAPDARVQACASPSECAAIAEQNASDRLDAIVGDAAALRQFLRAMPKGG